MIELIHDEKLLIHYFHKSLGGLAFHWYMGPNRTQIKRWTDLVTTFTKRYELNLELPLDRIGLQEMEKKPIKLLENMLKKWQKLVVQVNPPLMKKKKRSLFS
jgi:hypothetical protein